MNPTVSIGPVRFGAGERLAIIAGPCVLESQDHARLMARALAEASQRLGVGIVFKASFDKANRTSVSSFRGAGMDEGLRILAGIKREFALPVLTDIHDAAQAAPVAEVVDCLQIPALLCRQTDLLQSAARTGRPLNVKKGQFMAPWDMKHVLGKIQEAGGSDALLTERGTMFGYNRLIVDMTALEIMRSFGAPVVFDATHSAQLPAGQGNASGGNREFVPPLARAAAAVGIDGLFLEVHDNPERALSDGPNSLRLADFEPLIATLLAIRRAAGSV